MATMNEIDALRDVADKATERHRAAEHAACEALARLTEVALAPTMHCDDGALEDAADAYCATADLALDARAEKEKAEEAVLAALRVWWSQGCREPNDVKEPEVSLPETILWEDLMGNVRALHSLFTAPEPGLATWHNAVENRLKALLTTLGLRVVA